MKRLEGKKEEALGMMYSQMAGFQRLVMESVAVAVEFLAAESGRPDRPMAERRSSEEPASLSWTDCRPGRASCKAQPVEPRMRSVAPRIVAGLLPSSGVALSDGINVVHLQCLWELDFEIATIAAGVGKRKRRKINNITISMINSVYTERKTLQIVAKLWKIKYEKEGVRVRVVMTKTLCTIGAESLRVQLTPRAESLKTRH